MSAEPSDTTEMKRFLLLYASQTGQAEAIAEEVAERSPQFGLKADIHCLSKTEKRFWLERENIVVIVISTTGDGEPPDTALKFWRRIHKRTLSNNHLKHVKYALLGLGDSNYTNFCNCGKNLDKRLLSIGAQPFLPSEWADDAVGLEQNVDPWIDTLFPALNKVLKEEGESKSQEENDNSIVNGDQKDLNGDAKDLKQNGTAESNGISVQQNGTSSKDLVNGSELKGAEPSDDTVTNSENGDTDQMDQTDSKGDSISELIDDVAPSLRHSVPPLSESGLKLPALSPKYLQISFDDQKTAQIELDLKNLYNGCLIPSASSPVAMVPISSVQQLTSPDAVKTSLLMEVDLNDVDWKYEPGDSFGIICPNNTQEVEKLLNRLGALGNADQEYTLNVIEGTTKRNAGVPSHIPEVSTLRHVLTNNCDIRTAPKKAFLRSLVECTSNESEKRRLQELCSRLGSDDFTKYIRQPSVTLLDLLVAFPSCKPDITTILEHVPRLQPRAFSAASCQSASSNKMRFVFNVVEFSKGEGRSEARHGVCTGWLAHITQISNKQLDVAMKKLTLNDVKIPMYLRSGTYFRPPQDLSVPVIMIGPGTGVAPFIGFLQYRDNQMKEQEPEHSGTVAESWMFYGCRHPDKDYLFKEDLNDFTSRGILTNLHVSFSRYPDQAEDSAKYVQDNMRRNSHQLAALLCDHNAVVYVCGDAQNMAKDVNQAWCDIMVKERGMTEDSAKKFMMQTRLHKKYFEDVWT